MKIKLTIPVSHPALYDMLQSRMLANAGHSWGKWARLADAVDYVVSERIKLKAPIPTNHVHHSTWRVGYPTLVGNP